MRFRLCAILVVASRLLHAELVAPAAVDLPIQFREGLLWVEVCVPQRKEPLHFLLDSGASSSVVNLSTARQLGLELGPKVNVSAVAATLTGHWPVKLSAKASHVGLPDQYLALDLSKLSGACGRSVDGLIGADFFRHRVVEIDYLAQKLRLLAVAPSHAVTNSVPLKGPPGRLPRGRKRQRRQAPVGAG